MRGTAILLALALIGSSVTAEEESVRARVIDSETNRVPKLTHAPIYPRDARRDRIEGEVEVCFDVDRKGRTRRIAVRRSSHRIFEKPSIKAVRASTFVALLPDEPLQAIKSCRTFVYSLVRAT